MGTILWIGAIIGAVCVMLGFLHSLTKYEDENGGTIEVVAISGTAVGVICMLLLIFTPIGDPPPPTYTNRCGVVLDKWVETFRYDSCRHVVFKDASGKIWELSCAKGWAYGQATVGETVCYDIRDDKQPR